jgi:hypothetical protein
LTLNKKVWSRLEENQVKAWSPFGLFCIKKAGEKAGRKA